MSNKNVVLIHNEILFSGKQKEIMKMSGKWIELEKVILRWLHRPIKLMQHVLSYLPNRVARKHGRDKRIPGAH